MPGPEARHRQKLNGSAAHRQEMNGHHRSLNGASFHSKPGLAAASSQAFSPPSTPIKKEATAPAANATMEKKLRVAQDVLGQGRATLLQLAEQLASLPPDLEQTAHKITRLKQSHERLKTEIETARAEAKKAKAAVETSRQNLDAVTDRLARLDVENAMGEFRARHRKRERDRYRAAFHKARYFIFKPRLLRQWNAERDEKIELIERSGLFDVAWYLERCPDAKREPIRHYLWEGALEGLDPHPLFDTKWYLLRHRTARMSGENPLIHYLTEGWKKRNSPHPWFDVNWYLEQHPELLAVGQEPLAYFLAQPSGSSARPHQQFDPAWYKKTYMLNSETPDSPNPLVHFVGTGIFSGYQPSPACIPPQPSGLPNNRLALDEKGDQSSIPLSLHTMSRELESANEIKQLQEKLGRYEIELETRFHEIAYLTARLIDENGR